MTTPPDNKPGTAGKGRASAAELDEMILLVKQEREAIARDRENDGRTILARYEETIGRDCLAAMLADEGVARRNLEDENPRVRECALCLLAEHWKVGASIAGHSEELLQNDPDPEVREMAILALLGPYGLTQDPRISSLLARVVADEKEHPVVRIGAFRGLIDMRGLTLAWEKSPATLRFPEDIDWPFVESFLDSGHE